MGLTPTNDNAKGLSRYDPGCRTGHKKTTLTFVFVLQNAQMQQLDGTPLLDEEVLTSANILAHPSSQGTPLKQQSTMPTVRNQKPSDSAISVKQIHTLFRNITTRPKSNAELITVKNIPKLPLGDMSSGKSKMSNGAKSSLPRLNGKTFPAFHAQAKLYRSGNDTGSESSFFPGRSQRHCNNVSDSDSDDDADSDDSDSSDDD